MYQKLVPECILYKNNWILSDLVKIGPQIPTLNKENKTKLQSKVNSDY